VTIALLRARFNRLRNPCRAGHEWTELAQPPACRVCGRTREVVR
jgi:hypothetical protein